MRGTNLVLIRPDAPIEAIMRTPVATVTEDTSVVEIAEILAANDIGAVAVVRRDALIGVVSERDLVAQVAVRADLAVATAADVMSTDLLTVGPHESILAAAERANAALVRHLPVLDDRGLAVGFVSVRDLGTVLIAAAARQLAAGSAGA